MRKNTENYEIYGKLTHDNMHQLCNPRTSLGSSFVFSRLSGETDTDE